MSDWFEQRRFQVRLEWGWRGAKAAATRGDLLVVVDTLSFSTTAITAVSRGVIVYPCRSVEEAEILAARTGAVVATKKRGADGGYSLSPVSFLQAPANLHIALPSPNGATCCRYGSEAPLLLVGGIVNAGAVAIAISQTIADTNQPVTILACGERWLQPNEDGALRFALEDLLGAGAIIDRLPPAMIRSPEASAAAAVFRAAAPNLEATLMTCGSGIELVERGFPDDVRLAAEQDRYNSVPVLRRGERLEPLVVQ
jgi:2-phosphosulfolactate phosphatase